MSQTRAADFSAPDSPDDPQVRLQRVLAWAGYGSRRHCEEFITAGRVTVDGKQVFELGTRVNVRRQKIHLDGEPVNPERRCYYLLNKPQGYLCTNHDPDGRRRVIDLFPENGPRLFPVGRLDENSQGLLLVTNDGELSHRLAHPRFHIPRTYEVQVAGIPDREKLEDLRKGLYFAEGKFRVRGIRQLKVQGKSAHLEIVLTEGQNREIRRMLAAIGHKVMRLERVAFGPLKLGRLPVGQFRPLRDAELKELRALVSGGPAAGTGPRRRPAGASKRRTSGGPSQSPAGAAAKSGSGRPQGGKKPTGAGRRAVTGSHKKTTGGPAKKLRRGKR